jgi:hypothetical protein
MSPPTVKFSLHITEVKENFLVVTEGLEKSESVFQSCNVSESSLLTAIVRSGRRLSLVGSSRTRSGLGWLDRAAALNNDDVSGRGLLGGLALVDVELNKVSLVQTERANV